MKYYRFPENKIWNFCFAAFLMAQLMLTRSGMLGGRMEFLQYQLLMYGLIALAGAAFLAVNRRNLKEILLDRRMAAAAVFAVIMLVPMVWKRDWQMMYVTLLMGLLLAVFLSYFTTVREVARHYVLILCGLCVYSLIATYLLRRLPDAGLWRVPRFDNAVGNAYYNFGLCYVSITHVASRNLGVFREPGVYQFFLLLGLYLANYWVDWKKESHMWLANGILAVTMLSTMATGGVVELGLFVVFVFFDKKMYRDKRLRLLAIGVTIAACAVVIFSVIQRNSIYWFLYNTLLEKFINRTDSVTERADAIVTNIRLFLQNPVMGARFHDVLHGVNNNTSSTLILYAACGFFGGTLNVVSWIALVWSRERRLWGNLAVLVILFMSFNTQNLTWDLYFWLFPVLALLERGLPVVSKRKGSDPKTEEGSADRSR